DPFWETDVHELDMNDDLWEEFIVDRSHVNLNEFFHWLSLKDGMVSFDFSK
ncbi:F-box protein, partial [Trifolium medium]|nr:F-box protein [Trifolium medium]